MGEAAYADLRTTLPTRPGWSDRFNRLFDVCEVVLSFDTSHDSSLLRVITSPSTAALGSTGLLDPRRSPKTRHDTAKMRAPGSRTMGFCDSAPKRQEGAAGARRLASGKVIGPDTESIALIGAPPVISLTRAGQCCLRSDRQCRHQRLHFVDPVLRRMG